ncbi:MAG: hypothetical protein Q7R95_01775 [bacterium]|nr:hypothetical protein [bacterium]
MLKQKFISILLLCIFILCITFAIKSQIHKDQSYATEIKIDPVSVTADAFIGEFRFTLFGYTSPKALVSIQGMGIYDQTYANDVGYYEFHNSFSPLSPRDTCLTAQDQLGRTTSPTCIPPFPTQYNVTIGPVLLPPTLSLNQENYYINDDINLSGQSMPNSDVSISTFIDENRSITNYLTWGLVKPVNAATFPQLYAKTDSKGNFSISLPSASADFLRLFAQSIYQSSPSPESIKLNIKIYPLWMIVIFYLRSIFDIIKSRLMEIIIISELIIITYFFLRRYLNPHILANHRAIILSRVPELAIIDSYPAIREESAIMPYEEHPLLIE